MSAFRILVTGSRSWDDYDTVRAALAVAVYQNLPATIVHGACPSGADAIAAWWVRQLGRNLDITEERHRADWGADCRPECDHGPRRVNARGGEYCPAAGGYRNAEMVDAGADVVLAFINPCSKRGCPHEQPHGSHGASHTADLADRAGILVRRFPLRENAGGDAA